MLQEYLRKILTARVYEVAEETPLDHAVNLSRRLHNTVWLKREDEQQVFSFKLRGAYNRMVQLPPAVLRKGVITASAGNHAQGVALGAQVLRTRAIIVMPVTTPKIKIEAVVQRGAEVVLHGDGYDEAHEHAQALARRRGLQFIHPYDDPAVIAGQGTIAMEVLKQRTGPLHGIFVPVGGGGLIAGIAAYVKAVRPEVKVIGVEPEDADAMRRSLSSGRRVRLREVGIFADGVAVRQVGRHPYKIARQHVDDMVCVNTDEICAAIKDMFEDTRSIMEPAGALSVAGLKKYLEQSSLRGTHMVAIASGANMNFDRLRHVSERAELGERREAIIAVTIPERPGSFRRFCALVGDRGVTEFNYRLADPEHAHVYVGLQVDDSTGLGPLLRMLRKAGYEAMDLTDNEVAKLHVRHLVGGRAPMAKNEIVYRFEFPERRGALREFLEKMGQTWNISLFHYRNHGADFGRVLCGLQVPPGEKRAFREFLRNLGYVYSEETGNPAYRLFLST